MGSSMLRTRLFVLIIAGMAAAGFEVATLVSQPRKSAPAAESMVSLGPRAKAEASKAAGPAMQMPPRSAGTQYSTTPPSGPASPTSVAPASNDAPAPTTVVVHVAGQVRGPGVYTLPADRRVVDAIHAAGGPRPDADLDAVNMAARLSDGEQVYVPTHQAVASGQVVKQAAPTGRTPLAGPAAPPTGSASVAGPHKQTSSGATRSAAGSIQKLTDPSQGTVNLNTATADELARLPGVGPSTAQKILEFRQKNGRFTSPDDVMNVKGIGTAKFTKMQPFLRVE